MKNNRLFFIALIATHNRPTLLQKRALPSIAAQRRRPDMVVIVDDSDARCKSRNRKTAAAFAAQTGAQTIYIHNRRGRGASGAWNSGALAALAALPCRPEDAYLAILDDDDEWLPCHLANAETAAAGGADWLSAAFNRIEPDKRFVITPPAKINGADFLAGNPGTGGSALIMRLSVFMRAGMFDESLSSCTDRDLCFRLSLLPRLAYQPLPQPSVIHYADSHRPRLSSAGSAAKLGGLTAFADKYRGWMSGADYARFCRRAKKLFGWTPAQQPRRAPEPVSPPPPRESAADDDSIALIIGVIVEPRQFPEQLMGDILNLAKDKRLSSVDVALTPSSDAHRGELEKAVSQWRGAGLHIYLAAPAAAPKLREYFAPLRRRRPISVNRTFLQRAMSRLADLYRHPVCWILDGDNRLSALKIQRGRVVSYQPEYVSEIIRLRRAGCDAAIGGVCGAAPLPRALSIRTQLADVLHCLGRLLSPGQGRHAPAQTINNPSAQIAANYHHDCLSHAHLEQPAGIAPAADADELIAALPALINRLLAGDQVTRPLIAAADDGRQRGGNTLVFNHQMLSDFPNGFAQSPLAGLRRQDEIWRVFSEAARRRKVISGDFPVTQSRAAETPQAPDVARLANDIAGQAIMKAIKRAATPPCDDTEQIIQRTLRAEFYAEVKAHAERRLHELRASFYRIAGAAASMRMMIEETRGEAGNKAASALRRLERRFSPAAFAKVQAQTNLRLEESVLRQTLTDFPRSCAEYRSLSRVWWKWLNTQRIKNAAAALQKHVPDAPLKFLGAGGEGAVYASGQHAYKVLYRWYSRKDVTDTDFLPSLAGRWKAINGTAHILSAVNQGGDLILKMPYEPTVACKSGYGAGMTAMLAECYRAGICYWDINNDNLRRRNSVVRLIDYGADVRPFTGHDFDLMARKAWLCWRWGRRADLRALLSASLKNSALPELSGYEIMKEAAKRYAARYYPPDDALTMLLKNKPRRALDYGCGSGRDAIALAARGMQVSAYDPNLSAKARRRLIAAGVEVIDDIETATGSYDAILLHQVICEIRADAELRRCLENVRRLLAPRGQAFVTACHLAERVRETTCASHLLPRGADINHKFIYRKKIHASGNIHAHAHRPEPLLLREFSRAGLRVTERRAFDEIDIARFEKYDGMLLWTLQPLPPRPPAALIIRVCAMDAREAEIQTRQLVQQLDAPRGFAEIILALDAGEKDFLRQHTPGDLPLLRAAAHRLRRQGWIDRIVYAQADAARRLNKRWLGVSSSSMRSAGGAPLTMTFAAFAACEQRYALHVDIDMLIGRHDAAHDYLGEMLSVMQTRGAVTMALNIPAAGAAVTEGAGEPHRLEVRAGLTDLALLKKNLPLPGGSAEGMPALAWHRAADQLIARDHLVSLRGGDQRLFVAHPPNAYKQNGLDILANAAARGAYGGARWRGNDWDGEEDSWLPPPRRENFIFIICGRNVPAGRISRCLNSIIRQRRDDWGAVIMDDASGAASALLLRQWAARHAGKITLFCRRRRAGGLANLAFAVRRLCDNPHSVIITVDMDDALLSDEALCCLQREYAQGADVTVGSMLRTDKQAEYPVCFNQPRAHRGGNVWQHLRSFKKYLFDSIPEADLRDDSGEYYDLAADWACMLPVIETAEKPAHIKTPLYLYEPDTRARRLQRAAREAVIAQIINRPARRKKS